MVEAGSRSGAVQVSIRCAEGRNRDVCGGINGGRKQKATGGHGTSMVELSRMRKEFVYGSPGCSDLWNADQVQRVQEIDKCEPLSL